MSSYFTTKNGDLGKTRLLSGEQVSKSHPIVVCTGVLDTFRAQLAEARLQVIDSGAGDAASHGEFLLWLLHVCFLIGTEVNDPEVTKPDYRVATVGMEHVSRLEVEQARIEAGLSLPRSFIVTATNPLAARFDTLATEARALERQIVALSESVPGFQAAALIVLTNRISDYLVALARSLESGVHQPVDYRIVTGRN